VELLARHDTKHLAQLNGMFAFAAWFRDCNELLLVRDRFGVKPLYWSRSDQGIAFGSEIKALLPVTGSRLDMARVEAYLDQGVYPHGRQCFYAGINQLEAGSWLRFRNGGITEGRWFDLRSEVATLAANPPTPDKLEGLIADAIRLRLRSDVPISLHFSGGTDSTALLLKTKEVGGWDFPLVAYTIGFEDAETDESTLASEYCQAVGAEHRRVFLSAAEVPALAEELHRFQDEPYGGVPTIAYYKLNQAERADGFIVSIEGQGGDEGFGGYLSHMSLAALDLSENGADLSEMNALLAAHGVTLNRALSTARDLIAAGFQSHTDLTDLRATGARAAERYIDWLRTIQVHDVLINKIPRVLRFNDRASMACGREVRFPLLDWRVLTAALALPHADKYRGGVSKAPLREIIRRHLPVAYAEPKRSIVTPQTRWLRGELKEWALERINLLRRSAMLAERHFDRVDDFFAGSKPVNSFYVWQLINLSYLLPNVPMAAR
jgi:asparagine synthase (glutamine-hydrolysing)